jgi:hypothetical protein
VDEDSGRPVGGATDSGAGRGGRERAPSATTGPDPEALLRELGPVVCPPRRVWIVTDSPSHRVVRDVAGSLRAHVAELWLQQREGGGAAASPSPRRGADSPVGDVRIVSASPSSDFLALLTAPRLVLSVSTFAWWAAFLGNGLVVYPEWGLFRPHPWPASATAPASDLQSLCDAARRDSDPAASAADASVSANANANASASAARCTLRRLAGWMQRTCPRWMWLPFIPAAIAAEVRSWLLPSGDDDNDAQRHTPPTEVGGAGVIPAAARWRTLWALATSPAGARVAWQDLRLLDERVGPADAPRPCPRVLRVQLADWPRWRNASAAALGSLQD